MHRRRKFARLAGLAGITAIFSGVGMFLFAGLAWAHHPILDGTTVCANGDHVITWFIGNSHTTQAMTIVSTEAKLDTDSSTWPVTGAASPIAPLGNTTAETSLPGDLIGTVTLTVNASWPDGHLATRQALVVLTDPCDSPPPTTSPPTTGPPPTTAPPTTAPQTTVPGETTVPSETTAPGGTPTGDTPTTVCVENTNAANETCSLAYTGSTTTKGGTALAVGLIIVGLLVTGLAGIGLRRRF